MKKTALVTGASSGIGREIAIELNRRGYDLIISARREDRLRELKEQLKGEVTVIPADLSDTEQCRELYRKASGRNVSVLVNNAGFGDIGQFSSTDLEKELKMIDVNCKAVHILTKLFLRDFQKRNRGYILNVASSAGLMAGGPMMASYYATKSYVVNMTCAVNEELRRARSRVQLSALCPGPVDTEFNDVAGCSFGVKSISPRICAVNAVDGLFAGKMIIVPEKLLGVGTVAARLLPKRALLFITGNIQHKKIK
ncbi:SDR family oxidoreductase [Ruminococcus sp. Marseille-P6503]|uniref:SDR family NAD(P)-dependent oxidoreductase n=1 Tax=Ruminococcus sp. Marseille-P6503 TaxID=2364796 RepID=UPI000F543886|nr:SDR family oxidoreductase [Ruminococcus sp. Marseille-P6503]